MTVASRTDRASTDSCANGRRIELDGAGWVPGPGTSVGVRVPPSAVRILER